MNNDAKERLKQYLEEDVIYSEYKSGKCDMSDFDNFCIEHCKDIESILNGNEELQQENQELKKLFIAMEEVANKYKEVIDKMNKYMYSGYLINSKEIKNILKEVK